MDIIKSSPEQPFQQGRARPTTTYQALEFISSGISAKSAEEEQPNTLIETTREPLLNSGSTSTATAAANDSFTLEFFSAHPLSSSQQQTPRKGVGGKCTTGGGASSSTAPYYSSTSSEVLHCSVCNHSFQGSKRRYLLNRHMFIHTGVKPFQCPHCPHSTNRKENLQQHIFAKHTQRSA